MKQIRSNKTPQPSVFDGLPSTSAEAEALEEFFRQEQRQQSDESNSIEDQSILIKLNKICDQPRLSFDSNVFEHYENISKKDPEMYELATTVLGAPATQVSVERAFSSLGILMHYKRCSLKEKTIDDILTCHLNEELLNFINFENLAEQNE
jgi:hypothetical protein